MSDIVKHWLALHEALSLGRPLVDDRDYRSALTWVAALEGTAGQDQDGPLWGLVRLVQSGIDDYEERVAHDAGQLHQQILHRRWVADHHGRAVPAATETAGDASESHIEGAPDSQTRIDRKKQDEQTAAEVFEVIEYRYPLLEKESRKAIARDRTRCLETIVDALERKPDPFNDRGLADLAAEVIRQELSRTATAARGRPRVLSMGAVNAAFREMRLRGVSQTRCYELIAAKCGVSKEAVAQTILPELLSGSRASPR